MFLSLNGILVSYIPSTSLKILNVVSKSGNCIRTLGMDFDKTSRLIESKSTKSWSRNVVDDHLAVIRRSEFVPACILYRRTTYVLYHIAGFDVHSDLSTRPFISTEQGYRSLAVLFSNGHWKL